MATDLSQNIADNASGPAEASGDSGSMKQHSLRDQIEADRYLANKDAAKKGKLGGVKITRAVMPGTV